LLLTVMMGLGVLGLFKFGHLNDHTVQQTSSSTLRTEPKKSVESKEEFVQKDEVQLEKPLDISNKVNKKVNSEQIKTISKNIFNKIQVSNMNDEDIVSESFQKMSPFSGFETYQVLGPIDSLKKCVSIKKRIDYLLIQYGLS